MSLSNEAIFTSCNVAVLPGWVLLFVAPNWKWTLRIAMFTLPVLLAVAYVAVFIANFEGLQGNLMSLSAVTYLFSKPGTVLAGWIHYLTFDLFVGAWMVRDARRMRILHMATIPCLLLTFLLGPVGLLTYMSLRAGVRRGSDAVDK